MEFVDLMDLEAIERIAGVNGKSPREGVLGASCGTGCGNGCGGGCGCGCGGSCVPPEEAV